MRTKGIVFGILALFTVIALSATGVYAEEYEGSVARVSSIVTLDGSGLGIADDFAVADGCEEIKYDDGEDDGNYAWCSAGPGMGVHFTVTNPNHKTLKTARFCVDINDSVSSNSFDWEVLEWTGGAPGSVIASGTTTPAENGWHDVYVGDITVQDDFVIAMYWKQGYAPYLRCDSDPLIDERSWDYMGTWSLWEEDDYMIRAVVCDDISGTPDINVTPVELEARLKSGETTSKTLNIRNDGDGDLTYSSISVSCDVPEIRTTAIGAPCLVKIGKQIGAISASEEIGYDDGEANGTYSWPLAGPGLGVHFTVTNPDHKTLETARFYLELNESVSSNSFDWKVLGWTGSEPGSEIASGTTTPTENGWHDVDVGDITVPDDFVIAMYWKQGYAPYLGYDSDPLIDERSWDYTDAWLLWAVEDYMIRAVMDGGNGCDWLSVDKTSGTVAPGDCDDVIVTIDATDLELGSYSATITISSDDPDESAVTVTVTLDVIGLMEGDVNGDGCVSLKDSTAIKLNLVGRMDLTADQIKCADTNDDGEVSSDDSTLIREWLVDKSTTLWESPADEDMEKPVEC